MADPWLSRYDGLAQLGQEIMEAINDRNKNPKTSSVYAKKNATIRLTINRFGQNLTQLRESLLHSSSLSTITSREADRRQSMIDVLLTKQKHMDLAFQNAQQRNAERNSLLESTSAWNDSSSSPYGAEGNRGFSNSDLGVDQIRDQQRLLIEEQDRGLEALSKVIGRQKQIAFNIGDQVQEQNEIIDDIVDHADQTNTRLLRETDHITFETRKMGNCCMYIVIVLLLVAIIVVAVVPFR